MATSNEVARCLWRAAAMAVVAVACACSPGAGGEDAGEAPIPIAATHHELVVVTSPMKAAMTFSMVGLRRKPEKDDGATGLKEAFEEQVEPPRDGFVRRRFRVTLENAADQTKAYRIEIAYVSEATGETVVTRKFRRIVVPPFTRKQVSGYTPIREDRVVRADATVTETGEE